jgi:seryl-tRNA synthetase
MLSLAFIREHEAVVRAGARKKGEEAPIDEILTLDTQRRQLQMQLDQLLWAQKQGSEAMRKGGAPHLREPLREQREQIKSIEKKLSPIDAQLNDLLLMVPNVPHESVPEGKDEQGNVVVRTWGEQPRFPYAPRTHYDLGEHLDILDFPRAAKISGARFAVVKGLGAALERALISFMLDVHIREHGFTEIAPPHLVRREAMVGTAQLPKFEEDAFRVEKQDLFLIPTAEVPVTNLYREEVLDGARLPIRHVAYSACFRSEAGAAGKDTRGYLRLHQFNKVEMVSVVRPEASLDELERLTGYAEAILQALQISYQVKLMCTGDMGFAQWKKYDIDAWSPGLKRYLEVSSISTFGEFQARRANIRFRDGKGKPQYVHTLNGSGLALPRTMAALLETYQQPDGTVLIPEPLVPYLHGLERITPPKEPVS